MAQTRERAARGAQNTPPDGGGESSPQATRETVESIVVAVILAFLFRAFVAEAFVIPTGSMAPTLQGRHLDIRCPQCGYRYRTGASRENEGLEPVRDSTCGVCRFPLEIDRTDPTSFPRLLSPFFLTNQDSFNGDRILVSKFAYQLGDPERWDVIVFKYPGNAKQNYIKRLIGLPGEAVRIRHGDIYASRDLELPRDERSYEIIRKPPAKVKAMLQLIADSHHVGRILIDAGWRPRWQEVGDGGSWQMSEDRAQYSVDAQGESWLRYYHLIPDLNDWAQIMDGATPSRADSYLGQLITDYYAYNDYPRNYLDDEAGFGSCWVGDLAVEVEVDVEEATGELLLDLVEGGGHFTCRIDLTTGEASLGIKGGNQRFDTAVSAPTAKTSVRGKGRHSLRFANVDDQLLLWVNDRVMEFDQPTTFTPAGDVVPFWSPRDPGDLAPVGVGARDAKVVYTRLRVLRDVYYQAVDPYHKSEYMTYADNIREVFSNPIKWATTDLFASRRTIDFDLQQDQFLPFGDNSPQSKDARLWGTPEYVHRNLLIGKALLIYWPHSWRPFMPNFARMGLIR